jgi:hypothetical protein
MVENYFYTYYEHLNALERKIKASPINLGGIISSSGGAGGPPGGFLGMLPQTRVAYDLSEASLSGFVSGSPYDPSGVLISASLLDNMNHIRYRITALEIGGSGSGVHIYNNDILVATGVHILDFKGDFVDAVDVGGNEVEITVSGKKEFINLDDTPGSYSSQGNKFVTVNSGETDLEFTSVVFSGGTDWKVKVSANDTTQGFLEDKIVAGSNINVTVLNEGANEDIQVAASGLSQTGHTHNEADIVDLDHDATSIQGVVVSAIAPGTDEVLTYDGTRWTPAVLPGGSTASRVIGFYQETLSGGFSLPVRMLAPWAGTITNVVASVYTAPTVSAIIVDINKNGTTIFTTQGNRPTIAAGTLDDLSSTPDVTAVVLNDVFTCDIDQVGVSPGAGLVVQLRITV